MYNNSKTLYDFDCEKAVIGTLIYDPGSYEEVVSVISDECFYNNKYKAIFTIIRTLREEGRDIDLVSIHIETQKLKEVSVTIADLADFTDVFVGRISIYNYVCHLSELNMRRKLIKLSSKMLAAAIDMNAEIDETLSTSRRDIDDITVNGIDTFKSLQNVIDDINEIIKVNTANQAMGIPYKRSLTGFHTIDEKGGFFPGDLIIVAGESSMGKTSLANTIAYNIASNSESPQSVYICSLEMTNNQLVSRLLASKTNIPSRKFLTEGFSNIMIADFDKAAGELKNTRLFFDDKFTSNIDVIISTIRRMKMKHDISGAVIDYLQILQVQSSIRGMNKEQLMADVARRLKNLAKELGIWIMALSQLNRNNDNPEPNLNRLRDSGQIAEAADDVIFVYRPERYNRSYPGEYRDITTRDTAMLILAKGRNIGTGSSIVGFQPDKTMFTDNIPTGK